MSILTVCNANICRSPLAEALLRKGLSEAGGPAPSIFSAGVQAVDGMTLCPEAALLLGDAFETHEGPSPHKSRRLTTAMIDHAHLILVSTLDQRSFVAQLSPTARHRTFTFIEAASFLRVLTRDAVVTSASPQGIYPLTAIAAQMNALRSSIGPVEGIESHRLLHGNRKSDDVRDELDISDGHIGGRRRHRQTLDQIRRTVSEIADAFEVLGVRRSIADEGLNSNHS